MNYLLVYFRYNLSHTNYEMKEKSKFALVSTTVVSTNDKNKTVLSNMLHVQNVNYVILKIQYKKRIY